MTQPIAPFTRWTPHDIARLARLAEAGARWVEVAAAIGRASESCQMKWHAIATDDQKATRAAAMDAKRGGRPSLPAPVPKQKQAVLAIVAPSGPRTLTAAMFGDPLPGRSALDRKVAGLVDAPARDRRQVAQQPPRPTLPTEPLR
ncbi:hypothetical protein [Bradyrhizobium sp. SZCCHNRI1003]|uniref:hypothetical protein n=1 Tax=Bradyrhizobium sp. SZCCHNRI1003 TaxID=3057275 RepID=UPI002916E477|nr:hypothetical protein [Bradyrhizobium sp. SZCCHNRI1003]